MAISRERILDALALLSFIDAGELAIILGEPLATIHCALIAPLQDDVAQRVSHGTTHLPTSHRYYLTDQGIVEAADAPGYDAPSEFVRAYPASRQWLTLLLRRMDAVASVYRLAATLSLDAPAKGVINTVPAAHPFASHTHRMAITKNFRQMGGSRQRSLKRLFAFLSALAVFSPICCGAFSAIAAVGVVKRVVRLSAQSTKTCRCPLLDDIRLRHSPSLPTR